jgi:hypothetical protein
VLPQLINLGGELIDSFIALAHQEPERFDLAVADLYGGAQAADGRG